MYEWLLHISLCGCCLMAVVVQVYSGKDCGSRSKWGNREGTLLFTLLYQCCVHITVPVLFTLLFHYCFNVHVQSLLHVGSQCSCKSTESDQVSYTRPVSVRLHLPTYHLITYTSPHTTSSHTPPHIPPHHIPSHTTSSHTPPHMPPHHIPPHHIHLPTRHLITYTSPHTTSSHTPPHTPPHHIYLPTCHLITYTSTHTTSSHTPPHVHTLPTYNHLHLHNITIHIMSSSFILSPPTLPPPQHCLHTWRVFAAV